MSEQQKNETNNNMLYSIIIVLLVIIAILAFFVGKNSGADTFTTNNNATQNNTDNSDNTTSAESITITVIDDKRCNNCQTEAIVTQLSQAPELANATFVTKDFIDDNMTDFVTENEIIALPAIIFSNNNVGQWLTPYLIEISNWEYSLQVNSTFNPFAERSKKGFLLLDLGKLKEIKNNSYIKGNEDAKITWLEYSDLECPYCATLYENGTPKELADKYGNKLNKVFNHFPLDFHANAKPGAELLECLAAEKGAEAFYSLIEKSFREKKSTERFLLKEAEDLGWNKASLETCLDNETYSAKVDAQMERGSTLFGVTGTPGNVLINNETGEYEVISGAYPTSSFVEIIDKLLAE